MNYQKNTNAKFFAVHAVLEKFYSLSFPAIRCNGLLIDKAHNKGKGQVLHKYKRIEVDQRLGLSNDLTGFCCSSVVFWFEPVEC